MRSSNKYWPTNRKKKATLGDVIIGAPQSKSPVFINNHTTPFFGKLLAEGRKAIKEGKINSCWLNTFGCQLKFSEDGKSYGYRSIEELNEIIADGRSKAAKRAKPASDEDVTRPKQKKPSLAWRKDNINKNKRNTFIISSTQNPLYFLTTN